MPVSERLRRIGPVARVLLLLLAALPAFAAPSVHVSVGHRDALQAELDRAGAVVLDDDADYATSPAATLVLRSGQRIQGGWNTRLPVLIIPGGVSNVQISGITGAARDAPDIVLTGGEPNDDVNIVGANGGRAGGAGRLKVELAEGSRVNRLVLQEFGGLRVRHAHSGYVRDSLFSRLLSYWKGPVLDWQGNASERSFGNAMVGISLVTPQAGALWRDVGELWLVGWDCESWNSEHRYANECFSINGAAGVVSVGLSGGSSVRAPEAVLAKFARVDRLVTVFQHGKAGNGARADVSLREVADWLNVQDEGVTRVDDALPPLRARRQVLARTQAGVAEEIDANVALPAGLGLRSLPRPQRRDIGVAVAPTAEQLSADARPALQARLDKEHVVSLAAGIYVLHRPLELGTPDAIEGLIGPREGAAVLVAAGDFPIIKGRSWRARWQRRDADVRVVLSRLTFSGGSHGIRWSGDESDLGPSATVAWSTFSDLKFLQQRVAAVELSDITGLDSNLWQHVDIADVPVAIRGRGHGSGPGMNYADKQAFIDCQFQRIHGATWDWVADRSSGGEVWLDNVFEDVGQLTHTQAAVNLTWYNALINNVHGHTAIEVADHGSTATYYFYMLNSEWRGSGPEVVTDTQSNGIGTLFVNTVFGQRGGTLVAPTGRQVLSAWGSQITGSAQPGAIYRGLFIDSQIGPFRHHLQWVREGRSIDPSSFH